MEKKDDSQVLHDMSLTPQQRVDNMFALMEELFYLRKDHVPFHEENRIVLTRKNGSIPE